MTLADDLGFNDSIVALTLSLLAYLSSRTTSFVDLAHDRLTSSAALISQQFGYDQDDSDREKTWKRTGFDLFGVESESDKLVIGRKGDGAFGVERNDL